MAPHARRVAARAAIAVVALGATLAAHARVPGAAPGESDPVVPEPEVVRVASLGFDSLLADFYWLRAVQVVGAARSNPAQHAPLIRRLSEVVVALDPWVDHPYRFAALWLSDDPGTVHAANRILERGIAYHPTDWRNRFYLSFNHFFHLGDADAAAVELERALGLPGVPVYFGRLVIRLRSEGGDLDAASTYLEQMLASAPDDWHRIEYERALLEIETERRARRIDAARERYREQNGFDIERVEDLAWGPHAVVWELPGEPNGAGWTIDANTGEVVSQHYHRRYRVNFQNPAQRLRSSSSDGQTRGAGG